MTNTEKREERHRQAQRVERIAVAFATGPTGVMILATQWIPSLRNYGVPIWQQLILIAPAFGVGIAFGLLYHHYTLCRGEEEENRQVQHILGGKERC